MFYHVIHVQGLKHYFNSLCWWYNIQKWYLTDCILILCTATRYCPMLVNEGGVDILNGLVSNQQLHPDVYSVTKTVLDVVAQNRPASR